MQEMTRQQYLEMCLDLTSLCLTMCRTLSNTENRNLVMSTIQLWWTTVEKRRMLSRTNLPHFIQQEDGSGKVSNKPTDYQLRISSGIAIDAWNLARGMSLEAAKRVGLSYYETLSQGQ